MALSDDPTPALQPETFFATSLASERYAAIADAGGWPRVGTPLQPGARGKAVAALRKRLAAEGDLPAGSAGGEAWDAALTQAVKHFQFRMGLKQTGAVAGATLRELDVPASVHFRQLASSAQRLAGNDFPFGPRYVVVNIPSAAVDAVENGHVARRYTAIVGDVEHPSPEVEARIGAVNLNPTWTVPVSIIKNEIMPKMQKDPSYLAKARIRVFDNHGTEIEPKSINWANERAANYTLRQDSGAQNSLGSIRIAMPNKHAVYMHDTPSKQLAQSDYRFLSHGCVRVEVHLRPRRLAAGGDAGTMGQGRDHVQDRRRASGRGLAQACAGRLGLYDRMGFREWNRSLPQRYIWGGRSGRSARRALIRPSLRRGR